MTVTFTTLDTLNINRPVKTSRRSRRHRPDTIRTPEVPTYWTDFDQWVGQECDWISQQAIGSIVYVRDGQFAGDVNAAKARFETAWMVGDIDTDQYWEAMGKLGELVGQLQHPNSD